MSQTIFKTHPANIQQIKDCIIQHGICWFHGDGNMYIGPTLTGAIRGDHSQNAVDYSNPIQSGKSRGDGPGAFRIKFTRVEDVPNTVEEINELLIKAKGQEMQQNLEPQEMGFKPNILKTPRSEAEIYAASKHNEAEKLKAENDALKAAHDAEIDEVNKNAGEYIKNISADRDRVAQEAKAAKEETAKLRAELEALKASKIPAPAPASQTGEEKTEKVADKKAEKSKE